MVPEALGPRRPNAEADERCVMLEGILVATDWSFHWTRAALTAADLGRALGASLTLLAAYQVPPGSEGEPDYSRDQEAALRGANALLEAQAAAIAADRGLPARTKAIGGSRPRKPSSTLRPPSSTTSWSWGPVGSAISGAPCLAPSLRTWRRTARSRCSSSTATTELAQP